MIKEYKVKEILNEGELMKINIKIFNNAINNWRNFLDKFPIGELESLTKTDSRMKKLNEDLEELLKPIEKVLN